MTKQEAFFSFIDSTFELCSSILSDDIETAFITPCLSCPHRDKKPTLDCWKYRLADKCVEVMDSITKADNGK